jgi:hypothetical protein
LSTHLYVVVAAAPAASRNATTVSNVRMVQEHSPIDRGKQKGVAGTVSECSGGIATAALACRPA